jgi:hypothetical protein
LTGELLPLALKDFKAWYLTYSNMLLLYDLSARNTCSKRSNLQVSPPKAGTRNGFDRIRYSGSTLKAVARSRNEIKGTTNFLPYTVVSEVLLALQQHKCV